MDEVQRGVYQFHKKYNCPAPNRPEMPESDLLLLRARLIFEEAAEYIKAASTRDMNGMVDALSDLLYVTYGAAVVMGIDMQPICKEVQKSNMTKEGGHDSGGKVMKGPDFIPPDIEQCLAKQGWKLQ